MNTFSAVTGTIYFWFFIGAGFFAAALVKIITAAFEYNRKGTGWSRHLPAFYFYLALFFAVITLSVVFVDWKLILSPCSLVLFFLVSVLLFFIIFKFFLFWGIGLSLLLAGFVLFVTINLSQWQVITDAPIIAVRLLSKTQTTYTYEISIPGENDYIYSTEGSRAEGSRGALAFYYFHTPPWFFFIPGRDFILVDTSAVDTVRWIHYRDSLKILGWFSGVFKPFTLNRIIFSLPEVRLLWLYNVKFTNNKIVIVPAPVR